MVRIVNTAPVEFPLIAGVVPHSINRDMSSGAGSNAVIGHTQLPSHTSNCACSVRASPVAAAFGVGVSARALYAGDLGKHAQVVPLGVHGEVTLAF